eukprot:1150619-Pelagomonas_calceolata.AAC.9
MHLIIHAQPKPTAWSALRDHIKQLASDLKGVDGRFRPGLVYMQQFLFEHLGAKADALEPAVQVSKPRGGCGHKSRNPFPPSTDLGLEMRMHNAKNRAERSSCMLPHEQTC